MNLVKKMYLNFWCQKYETRRFSNTVSIFPFDIKSLAKKQKKNVLKIALLHKFCLAFYYQYKEELLSVFFFYQCLTFV